MTDQLIQDPENEPAGTNGNPPDNGAKFTQADLDRIVKDRLDRERAASKAKLDALQAELEGYKASSETYQASIDKMIAERAKDLPQAVLSIFDKLTTADKLAWLEENADALPTKKSVKPVPEGRDKEPDDAVDAHLKILDISVSLRGIKTAY